MDNVIEKYPNFAKYEKLTGGTLSAYILELCLKGQSDDRIAVSLGVRWAYLFEGLTWEFWRNVVSEFRSYQKECVN